MASRATGGLDVSEDVALHGSIRWEVDKAIVAAGFLCFSAPRIEVGGTTWTMFVATRGTRIAVFLSRMNSTEKVDASIEYRLINHNDQVKTISAMSAATYLEGDHDYGVRLIELWKLFNVREGFVKDGKITVQINFTLPNVDKYRKPIRKRKVPRADFSDPNDPAHDVVLVIGGEKTYVNKGILKANSTFFRKMFDGDFIEKNQKEIEIKDVDRKEFIEMLYMIQFPYGKVTDANFEFLLKLADRFDIEVIMYQVEQFLIASPTISVVTKLMFAGQYRLAELEDRCLDSLKTTKDVTNLKNSSDYERISDGIKLKLLDKIMDLSN